MREAHDGFDLDGGNGEAEKVPLGLSIQWPLIRVGRSVRNMVKAYNRFFSVSSDDLREVYQKRARRAEERGDADGCLHFMEKVVALDPEDADALYALGVAYEQTKQPDRAQSCYRKVLKQRPTHAKARFRIGMILLRKQEFKAAIKAFEAARKQEPKSPDIYFRMGQAYDRLQEHAKAIECFNKAVEIDGEFLPAYKNMALTYDSMNKHKQALECLKRALELEELNG
jgi:tetratricopeptide (TPR) repeat protein